MLAHSHAVISALFNVRLSWAGQNRTEETGWREASVRHLPGLLIGGAWSAFAWTLDPMFFFWSLPVSIPLLLAAPTTVWLSRLQSGRSEEHTSELQSRPHLVCRLLLEKKKY